MGKEQLAGDKRKRQEVKAFRQKKTSRKGMEVRVPFGFWGRCEVRRGGMVGVKAGEVGGGSILKTLWELRLDPEGYKEPCLVVKPEGTTQSRTRNQSLAFSAFSALRPLALT